MQASDPKVEAHLRWAPASSVAVVTLGEHSVALEVWLRWIGMGRALLVLLNPDRSATNTENGPVPFRNDTDPPSQGVSAFDSCTDTGF